VARKTTVVLEDDLSGQLIEEDQGGTVSFSLDGQNYEIDLAHDNYVQLRRDFQKYVDAARRVSAPRSGTAGRRPAGTPSALADRKESGEIRDWARKNGHEVSERGRIKASVVAAYRAAH